MSNSRVNMIINGRTAFLSVASIDGLESISDSECFISWGRTRSDHVLTVQEILDCSFFSMVGLATGTVYPHQACNELLFVVN